MAKRISERLAELLNDALKPERPISASDFWMQHGDYRKARWDLARWGATVRVNGGDRSVCSWDTMTECVRKGISVTVSDNRMGDRSYANFEISVKRDEPKLWSGVMYIVPQRGAQL